MLLFFRKDKTVCRLSDLSSEAAASPAVRWPYSPIYTLLTHTL